MIDEIVTELVGDEKMERFLFCMDCLREKGLRRFFSEVDPLFRPRSDIQLCGSEIGHMGGDAHNLNANQLSLMARENPKAEDLKAFLKEGIKNIKKTTLGERSAQCHSSEATKSGSTETEAPLVVTRWPP